MSTLRPSVENVEIAAIEQELRAHRLQTVLERDEIEDAQEQERQEIEHALESALNEAA